MFVAISVGVGITASLATVSSVLHYATSCEIQYSAWRHFHEIFMFFSVACLLITFCVLLLNKSSNVSFSDLWYELKCLWSNGGLLNGWKASHHECVSVCVCVCVCVCRGGDTQRL
jgi:predicted ferric reductase